MLSQRAFSDPDVALSEYLQYLDNLKINQNWPDDLIFYLQGIANAAYNEAKSFFRSEMEETVRFWRTVAQYSIRHIQNYIQSPDELNGLDSYILLLANASDTSLSIEQTTGIIGAGNLVLDQLDEVGEVIVETAKKVTNFTPILIIGGILFLILRR